MKPFRNNHDYNTSNLKKSREVRELFWIKRPNTAYPFGFNDHILGQGNISINIVDKQLRNKRSHGKSENRNQSIKHRILICYL